MIEVYDDLFTPDFILETYNQAMSLSWKFDNKANRGLQYPPDSPFSKGSHHFFGSEMLVTGPGYQIVSNVPSIFWEVLHYFVFQIIKETPETLALNAIQGNLQAKGQDGTWHRDNYTQDGSDRTILYYPHHEWKEEWGGEFQVKDGESYLPLPGRIIYMDSAELHRGLGPKGSQSRISIVYRMVKK